MFAKIQKFGGKIFKKIDKTTNFTYETFRYFLNSASKKLNELLFREKYSKVLSLKVYFHS